ncbi:Plk/plk-unclassified protein kinase, partial [Globisporangium splendens]
MLETKVDDELAVLRRLRTRARSEKENDDVYQSPYAHSTTKLRSSTATTRSSSTSIGSSVTTRPITRASLTAMAGGDAVGRLTLPSSVTPRHPSVPPLHSTTTTRASTIGLVRPIEKPVRQSERIAATENKKLVEEAQPQQQQPHKPQQVAQVPERIFECVLDDEGCVTSRCFIKGKFLGKYAGKIVAKSSLVKPKAKQKSLSDLLRRRKRISEPEVRFYIRQLIDGIEYLHSNLVIHRDLKLGNLFLTSDMEIKIGDFGLATRLDTMYDRKRTMCGTPNYIAPEILNGMKGDGHSFEVDIWSMGVVMYTLLVGRPPFETEDVKDTYKRIRANQFRFPEDTTVSESAQSLIRSILRSEPHLRPSLRAILAHPFFKDEPTPASLPKAALLITPPDCKRKPVATGSPVAERDRASVNPMRATHPVPPAPRRYPLRSRDVNAQSSSGGELAPEEDRPVLYSGSAKRDVKRSERVGITTTRSGESALPAPSSSPSLSSKRSEERPNVSTTQDPLETIFLTLSRLFALEETGNQKEKLDEFSSATAIVDAAKRLKEIREETGARSDEKLVLATLWVSQWVDYTSKYGMGYMLSNGCSGVYFNDSTKAIASADDQFFEYLERTSDATNAVEHRVRYTVGKHDPSLTKKVTLLKHFKSYLVDGRAENEEAELLESQLAQLPHSRTDRVDENAPMEFVKKWVKTRHAVLFCLSNDTFQINFFDSSKLVISQEGRVVTYLDKDGELAVFASAMVILKNERPDLLKRLRYSKDMLQQMVKVYATSSDK